MATVAVVFAMTGGAIAAAGGVASGGKLQACVGEGGSIKLLKPGKQCKEGQKRIAWNQTGPAGPIGAAGAAGAPGAAGATGGTGGAGAPGAKGEGVNTAWAGITEQGDLENGHAVVASELQVPGIYLVTFGHDVSNCSVLVTANANSSVRIAASALRSPEGKDSQVVVATRNEETAKIQSTPFSIAADC